MLTVQISGKKALKSFIMFLFGCCFNIVCMTIFYEYFIHQYVKNLLRAVELNQDDYCNVLLNIDNKETLENIFFIIFLFQNMIFVSILIFFFSLKSMLYINELIIFFKFYTYFIISINVLILIYITAFYIFLDPNLTLTKFGLNANYANEIINIIEIFRKLQEEVGVVLAAVLIDKAKTNSVIFLFFMNYQIFKIYLYLYIIVFLHVGLLFHNIDMLEKSRYIIPYKQFWLIDYVTISYNNKILKEAKKEIDYYPYGYIRFTYEGQAYNIKVYIKLGEKPGIIELYLDNEIEDSKILKKIGLIPYR